MRAYTVDKDEAAKIPKSPEDKEPATSLNNTR